MAFKKGVSGNPNGRAARRVEDAQKSLLDRLMTAKVEEQMINAMINKVMTEGDVPAFKALMERRYGKVTAPTAEADTETVVRVEFV